MLQSLWFKSEFSSCNFGKERSRSVIQIIFWGKRNRFRESFRTLTKTNEVETMYAKPIVRGTTLKNIKDIANWQKARLKQGMQHFC